MSATLMQPSQDEIQREVENLRDIKRRSTLQGGPGALILDPDLPTAGAQAAAAQATYWNPSDDSSSDSHSHEDASSTDSASDDPFHLFWVPANMHPEIDPGQFRAFLKEHAHTPTETEVGLARSESFGNPSLGRKKSMLSRQYRPSENDGVEDEQVVPLRRNRSSLYATSGPQLTIKDLEKLDELVEEASKSRDPSKLRSVLRRSLSMNMSPSVIDNLEHAMPDSGDDVDAPIIVPRPGQVLRRSARTKIRKAGQTVQGAHRFNATRRGAGSKRDTPPPVPDPRSSSDFSAGEGSDAEPPRHSRLLSNESLDEALRLRPESYSAEAFIFDAYARDEVNEDAIRMSSPPLSQSLPRRSLSPPLSLASKEGPESALPIQVLPPAEPTSALPPLQHPLPQRAASLVSQPAPVESPSRSPSPVTSIHSEFLSSTRPELRPAHMPSMSPSSMHPGPQGFDARREKEKEKDRKGLFKWGGGEKKGKKDQREKDKDAGFFGSFFSSKRKPEESPPMGLVHGQSARDAAVALLGAPKSSRGYIPSPSPQPPVNNYSRYPIHVERAIYRLSHIKLANPRRALYEQVLISNLMFWYLGVINKTQQPQQAQSQASTEKGPAVTGDLGPAAQNEHEEQERAEVEQAEIERGEARSTMQGQGQGQGQQPASVQQSPPQGRRGSLTKVASSNTSPRRAEQPVRGPQYDMQHRVMEQEYGVAFSGARSTTTPAASSGAGLGYAAVTPGTAPSGPIQVSNSNSMPMSMSMSMSGPGHPPPPSSSSPHNATHLHAPSSAIVGGTSQARSGASPRRSRSPPPPLGSSVRYVPPPPPPPVPITATASSGPSPNQSTSAPPAPASGPNSPALPGPLQALVSADARPTRSLSANATPPVGPRNPGRKAQSAHAVLPLGARRPRTAENPVGVGREEEDVPLALWQQQQQQQQQQQYQQSLVNQQVRRR